MVLVAHSTQLDFEACDSSPLGSNLATDALTGVDEFIGELRTNLRLKFHDEPLRDFHVVVGGDAHTETKLGVVLEQGI
jgi:hypothetical protein